MGVWQHEMDYTKTQYFTHHNFVSICSDTHQAALLLHIP